MATILSLEIIHFNFYSCKVKTHFVCKLVKERKVGGDVYEVLIFPSKNRLFKSSSAKKIKLRYL